MITEREIRQVASDDAIPARLLRDFVLQALRHDAIRDVLLERMVFRAEGAGSMLMVCPPSCPDLIAEVLDATACEDWIEVADALIEDTREALQEEVER